MIVWQRRRLMSQPLNPTMADGLPSHPCSRRRFVALGTGAAVWAWAGTGRAGAADPAADPTKVSVANPALAAVVAAIGGAQMDITVDPSVEPTVMHVGTESLAIADRIMLKGQGEARHRFLDDARNAPKLGSAVRDHLRTALPQHAKIFEQRHQAWSRAIVRQILQWTQQLGRAGLRGKRVWDLHDRIYLLEWAGAVVTQDGADPPPGLSQAPEAPATPTPDDYQAYVQALVDACSP